MIDVTYHSMAFNLLKGFEGLKLGAYQDSTGIWTIGYGHTPAVRGEAITEAEANALLEDDMYDAENTVNEATKGSTAHQYAAMVSLCFNIGHTGFLSSSVLKWHLAGLLAQAAGAFLLWDKAHVDGALVTLPGLLNRRRAEQTFYLTAD